MLRPNQQVVSFEALPRLDEFADLPAPTLNEHGGPTYTDRLHVLHAVVGESDGSHISRPKGLIRGRLCNQAFTVCREHKQPVRRPLHGFNLVHLAR